MTSPARLKRAFVPLAEFKRLVRELGFDRAGQLKAWLKSSERPLEVPKTPQTVYRKDGWVSYVEALGLPRTQRETIDPEAIKALLSDPDRNLSSRYGKITRADVAIAWVENFLSDLGYETKRLPRELQGSLLLRQKQALGSEKADLTEQNSDKPVSGSWFEGKWWALQVRSVHGSALKTRTGVCVARNHAFAELGLVVVHPEGHQACALHLDSVKLSEVTCGYKKWLRFSMPRLFCVAEEAGRSTFSAALQDMLVRLPVKSQREWLLELRGNAAAVRYQKLFSQFLDEVVLPCGFEVSTESSRLTDARSFLIAGRKCAAHSCKRALHSERDTQLPFKRTRIVNGRQILLPFGYVEDFDFLIALIYDDDTENLAGFLAFPRFYLIKWGICAQNFAGGQTGMTLHPPGNKSPAAIRYTKSAAAEEQRKFYIDLSHTSAGESTPEGDTTTSSKTDTRTANSKSQDNIEKFGRIILGSYGECSAPPPTTYAGVFEDSN
ncbi:unnamed protein product [Amoebophrya sp. A25]|nr:unnamed protein product [Amoebophrya sp. A25]|eukprot:GSA25T00015374001.1